MEKVTGGAVTEEMLWKEIQSQFSKKSGMNLSAVRPEGTMEEIGDWSLDTVDIVSTIEEEFHLKVNDAKLGTVKTVGDIFDLFKEAL